MGKQIKIVVVEPMKEPEVQEIDNGLEAIQKIVGGYIETVTFGNGLILICDEEGKVSGKIPNRLIPQIRDIIAGTFFLAKGDDEGNFDTLSDEEVKTACKIFSRDSKIYKCCK